MLNLISVTSIYLYFLNNYCFFYVIQCIHVQLLSIITEIKSTESPNWTI